MSVQAKKINSFINAPISVKTRKVRETPPDLPPYHYVINFCGARGSGKTHSAVNWAKKLQDSGSLDRIFVMSPTYYSNPIFSVLNILPEDVYGQDISMAMDELEDIISAVEEEGESYRKELQQKRVFEKFEKIDDINKLDDDEIFTLMDLNFEKPIPKYGHYKPRAMLLIIDDMSHSPILSNAKSNKMINLLLRNRHIGGVGIGLNIFILTQSLKNGLPKVARGNLSQIVLYKSYNEDAIKDFYDEMIGHKMSYDKFKKLYEFATEQPHDFLLVDFNRKKGHPFFRKNFDTEIKIN
jgi:type I site-specific restriction endonuclease